MTHSLSIASLAGVLDSVYTQTAMVTDGYNETCSSTTENCNKLADMAVQLVLSTNIVLTS